MRRGRPARWSLRWVVLALLLVPVSAHASEAEDDAASMVTILESLADTVGEAPFDCDAMAVRIVSFGERRGEEMRRLSAALSGLDEAQSAIIEARFAQRLESASERMLPGLKACAGHEGVVEAMKALAEAAPAETGMTTEELAAFCEQWRAATARHAEDCAALGSALQQQWSKREAEAFRATDLTISKEAHAACREAYESTRACKDDERVEAALEALGQ